MENIGKGIGNQYEKFKEFYNRLSDNTIEGWKSFSENPVKHTKETVTQLGKDYWDLLVSIISGYVWMKTPTKAGTPSDLYTNLRELASIVWIVNNFSPYIFDLEKNRLGNHFRAIRNFSGGTIPILYFINSPPLNWFISLGSGGSVGALAEFNRRKERKKASIPALKEKPGDLEDIIKP